MTSKRLELLVRAADAGDTFMSWTWLQDSCDPQVSRCSAAELDATLMDLDRGLLIAANLYKNIAEQQPPPLPLVDGPFSTYLREHDLASALATAVIPPELNDQILRESETRSLRLRITPSPRLSRVPWETLVLSDGRRLIEAAEIVLDPPAAIYAARSRAPSTWAEVADKPALRVIDPLLQDAANQVLTEEGERSFRKHLAALRDSGRTVVPDTFRQVPRVRVTRGLLSDALRIARSRLFYLGHVSSDPDQPGTAALHLSDKRKDYAGLARPAGGHLPLSALDLLLGTSLCEDPDEWDKYDSDTKQLGHEIWPMPSRVALVACEGSVDFRSAETFGLVIAILDSGAELVTTTRWPLPTDSAFHHAGFDESVLPTTEMALRIDAAHETAEPVAELREWQLGQLRNWQDKKISDPRYSPITWAALTHTYAPRREC